MNELELTGRARTHIIDLEQPRCALHFAVVASLLSMRDAAARAGVDLVPATVNGAVARWTNTPALISVLTNLVAVRKSTWSDGMMNPRGSRIFGSWSTSL